VSPAYSAPAVHDSRDISQSVAELGPALYRWTANEDSVQQKTPDGMQSVNNPKMGVRHT